MGVPPSEVGYIIATTRRENHEVHKNRCWHWREQKGKDMHYNYVSFQRVKCNLRDIASIIAISLLAPELFF